MHEPIFTLQVKKYILLSTNIYIYIYIYIYKNKHNGEIKAKNVKIKLHYFFYKHNVYKHMKGDNR